MRSTTFVRTGDLDTPVIVQRKAIAADPEYVAPDGTFGTEKTVWVPLVRSYGDPSAAVVLWANFQDALPSRSESVLQGAVTARNQTRMRMRWRDDMDSSMRIVAVRTLAIYQIIGGPAMLGRRQFLEVQCERIGFYASQRIETEGGGALLAEDGKILLDGRGTPLVAEGGEIVITEEASPEATDSLTTE
jgi:head-tail adaptor